MKKYTEFTGRTVEEAIEEGLAALGLTEEDAAGPGRPPGQNK